MMELARLDYDLPHARSEGLDGLTGLRRLAEAADDKYLATLDANDGTTDPRR
jgi:hypothetical protein